MSKSWDYNEDKTRIVISPPTQRLRITGHRIATILGLDEWSTPFKAWCEITKLVKAPFEETKYTIAGKAAEPKIIEYVAQRFPNVVSIEDYYGNIFEEYRWNNFKDESKIFGGVIDAVSTANDKTTIAMICECKTSSKPQEWRDNNVPVTYMLQGALYSYLKGLDRVLFACTFLTDMDYAHPENIKVTDENTVLVVKKLDNMLFEIDGEYLNIKDIMKRAEDWWNAYVETGISPEFDETKDKDYLDMIRATDVTKDTELEEVCDSAIKLSQEIKQLKETYEIDKKEKELKVIKESIKNKMIESNISSCGYYKVDFKQTDKFDEKRFAEENPELYADYLVTTTSYTLREGKVENGN